MFLSFIFWLAAGGLGEEGTVELAFEGFDEGAVAQRPAGALAPAEGVGNFPLDRRIPELGPGVRDGAGRGDS